MGLFGIATNSVSNVSVSSGFNPWQFLLFCILKNSAMK